MVGFIHHPNYALQNVDILNLLGFRIDQPSPTLELVRKRIHKVQRLLHTDYLQGKGKKGAPPAILDGTDRDIDVANLYALTAIIGRNAKTPESECRVLWEDIWRRGQEGFVQRWNPLAPTLNEWNECWKKYYPVKRGETASAIVISSDEDEEEADQDQEETRDIPRISNKDNSALLVNGNTGRDAPQVQNQPLDIGIDKRAQHGAHTSKPTEQKVQQTLDIDIRRDGDELQGNKSTQVRHRDTTDLSQGELTLSNLRALGGPNGIAFATVHGPSNSKDKPHQYVVVASLDQRGWLNIRVRSFTLRGERLPAFGRRTSSYTFNKTRNEGTLLEPFKDERSIRKYLSSSEDVRDKDTASEDDRDKDTASEDGRDKDFTCLETGSVIFATIPGPLNRPEYEYIVVGSLDKNEHLSIRIRNFDMKGKKLPLFGRRAGKHAIHSFSSVKARGTLIGDFDTPFAVREHLLALKEPSASLSEQSILRRKWRIQSRKKKLRQKVGLLNNQRDLD
ncbi:hypothetical protein IFR05_016467 [Cadophora sp. M221]|nr:hypothetical protein IFR05_016467 [Cadophora sp. M221]